MLGMGLYEHKRAHVCSVQPCEYQSEQSFLYIVRCFHHSCCLTIEMKMATLAPHVMNLAALLLETVQFCKLLRVKI